jgi:hypothetical protein
MSTDITFTDDRGPDPAPDPHGILADTPFVSMREAEAKSEQADGGDDEDRCPKCESARVREKQDNLRRQPNRKPEDFKCLNCSVHFDRPLAPGEDLGPGRQIELGEVDGNGK